MYLSNQQLANPAPWEKAGIALPAFDRAQVSENTRSNPIWVHFGAGNIFRAFPAMAAQTLLNQGLMEQGIIVAEGYDYEIIDKAYRPFDNLSLLVTLKADGTTEKTVVGSIVESLKMDRGTPADFTRLQEIFAHPGLQMVSFTITEKGYSLANADGQFFADVQADFSAGPAEAGSYMGKVAALCYHRYSRGGAPLALVSMDNCSHNGTKLFEAIHAFALQWEENVLIPAGFAQWIASEKVSFPWSMIDKITPHPHESITQMLDTLGFENTQSIVTAKHTATAAFVNAEETEYLVIEDNFPNGRPCLEKAGIYFTSRETVDKVEKMKVCTCLNPLHTALGIFGCLLGYTKISDEMNNPVLVSLIRCIGETEGMPVVVDPGILSPTDFLHQVIHVRLPNPFMPDTPQRIVTDTSQKLSIRFGETIKAYLANPNLSVSTLTCIPLALAGWCRYLMGIDDQGNPFTVSPDPLYPQIAEGLQTIVLGESFDPHPILQPLLSNEKIFGINLYTAGLGQKVEDLFVELTRGPGSVAATLERHVS